MQVLVAARVFLGQRVNLQEKYDYPTEQPSADDQPASVYEQTFVQENGFKVMMVTYEAE